MAFRDFSPTGQDIHVLAPAPVLAARAPVLSELERVVVRIGAGDPRSSLAPSALGKLVDALFGLRRPNGFADERLEALRSLAVRLSHGRSFRKEDPKVLSLQAGLTRPEISQVSDLVGALHT